MNINIYNVGAEKAFGTAPRIPKTASPEERAAVIKLCSRAKRPISLPVNAEKGFFSKIGSKIKNAAKATGNFVANMFSKVRGGLSKAKTAIAAKIPQWVKTTSKYTGMALAGLTVAAGLVLAGKEVYDHIWGEESGK